MGTPEGAARGCLCNQGPKGSSRKRSASLSLYNLASLCSKLNVYSSATTVTLAAYWMFQHSLLRKICIKSHHLRHDCVPLSDPRGGPPFKYS
jgi:hypothetical protein